MFKADLSLKRLVPAGGGPDASGSMGCPPDPADVSIWRSGERIASLQERYDTLRSQYADAVQLAVAMEILSYAPLTDWPPERFTTRTDVHPTEYDQYADVAAQSELERNYEKRVKALENTLCELRTQILARQGEVGAAEMALFEEVSAAHLQHREDDRQTALAWLRERRAIIKGALGMKDEAHLVLDRPRAERLLQDINQRIRSLSRVRVERLVRDRALTQIDEGKYVIPYR